MLLLSSALVFYTFMFAFTVRRIRTKMDITNAGVFSLVRTLPESFVLAAFSFMTICALGCLLAFHAFLVAKNTVHNLQFFFEGSTNLQLFSNNVTFCIMSPFS